MTLAKRSSLLRCPRVLLSNSFPCFAKPSWRASPQIRPPPRPLDQVCSCCTTRLCKAPLVTLCNHVPPIPTSQCQSRQIGRSTCGLFMASDSRGLGFAEAFVLVKYTDLSSTDESMK